MHQAVEIDFDTVTLSELSNHLESDNPRLRADAACALGDRLRTREVLELPMPLQGQLVRLLDDKVPIVRFEAAMALAEMQDHRGTDVLLASMRIRTFRLDAVRALGTMGDTRAIEALRHLLDRWLSPWADKLQAAAALCALGNAEGANYLKLRLHSKRAHERAAAIHFLGESQHPEAKTTLTHLLLDPQESMRDVATRALGLLGDASSRPVLEAARKNADADLSNDIDEAIRRLDLCK